MAYTSASATNWAGSAARDGTGRFWRNGDSALSSSPLTTEAPNEVLFLGGQPLGFGYCWRCSCALCETYASQVSANLSSFNL